MRFPTIDIEVDDLERGDAPAVPWSHGALVVARRVGVPVGSVLIDGPSSTAQPALASMCMREGNAAGAPPPGRALSITVAVCTRNRPALLHRCLTSIRAAIDVAQGEFDVEILVIDNASSDALTSFTALAHGARTEREPVPGLNVARNHAVASIRSDIVSFVDDDVCVDPYWLRTVGRTFAADRSLLAVTGGVLAMALDTPAQREFERCGGFFKGWGAGYVDASTRSQLPFNPSIGVGCNMSFRRSAFELTGPFDEALDTGPPLAGGGDLDMLSRVVMAGPVFYEPSALVRHEHRRTSADLRRQYVSWGKSWGAVLHKWYRAHPEHRPLLRSAAMSALRHYGHEMVVPTRGAAYKRSHAALMLAGFVGGITVAHPRSVRRMGARRRGAVPSPT